jgi:predicted RNA-binding Zn ribbon-like protein
MSASKTGADMLKLTGGRLCLDFTNTVGGRNEKRPHEYLRAYGDLIAKRFAETAVLYEVEAELAYRRGLDMREALYRIFSAVATKRRQAQHDLAIINGVLAEGMAQAEIIPAKDGFVWGWTNLHGALTGLLWPIARSAAELLAASDELRWVRECPGDNCDWLFLDTSKNHQLRTVLVEQDRVM